MGLSLVLSQAHVTVQPGSAAQIEVQVAHDGAAPERVRFELGGAARPWSWVIPAEAEIVPGTPTVVKVGFRLPKGHEPAAGDLGWEVRALPGGEQDGAALAVAPGTLTVAPWAALAVEVDPEESTGRGSSEHRVTVQNLGNVALEAEVGATSPGSDLSFGVADERVPLAPGQRAVTILTVRPPGRPLRGARVLPFSVSASVEDVEPAWAAARVRQTAVLTTGMLRMAAAVAVVAALVGVKATVFSSGGGSDAAATATTTTIDPAEAALAECPVTGHIDGRVSGLTPERIPTLPAGYSFFNAAEDGCNPVRWNPCEPVHFAINPAQAPPSGLADVREAFRLLSEATGITYIEDPLTDESGNPPPPPAGTPDPGRMGTFARAYQPERYGERWAPILVRWVTNNRERDGVQIVGSGFPTRSGDAYVTGLLTLNPEAHTDQAGQVPVEGGFGSSNGFGALGPTGVTWGRIILHELAHIMGMGHVRDPAQLMYPETSQQTTRPTKFAPGDLKGLELIGRKAGCTETPAPGSPVGGI